MITGREKFSSYKKLINIVTSVFSVLPKSILLFLWSIVYKWENSIGVGLRYCIIKVISNKCGENVYIASNVIIKNMKNLSIGSNVSIHQFCYIDANNRIEIGDNVSIAHGSSIIDFNHTWKDSSIPIKYNDVESEPIIIMNDVWVGCGSRILSGTTINKRSVIAAGSVVNKDIPENVLAGGVPVKIIKKI